MTQREYWMMGVGLHLAGCAIVQAFDLTAALAAASALLIGWVIARALRSPRAIVLACGVLGWGGAFAAAIVAAQLK